MALQDNAGDRLLFGLEGLYADTQRTHHFDAYFATFPAAAKAVNNHREEFGARDWRGEE